MTVKQKLIITATIKSSPFSDTPSYPKCPKCRGEMEKGRRLIVYAEVTLAKEGDDIGTT